MKKNCFRANPGLPTLIIQDGYNFIKNTYKRSSNLNNYNIMFQSRYRCISSRALLKVIPSGHSSAIWCYAPMWCLPTSVQNEWCVGLIVTTSQAN